MSLIFVIDYLFFLVVCIEGANVGKKRKADRYIKRKRAKRARAAFLTSMDVPGDQYELNDVFEKDFKVDE